MPATNVLIPLDGSAFSRQVLPYVRRLLRPGDDTLTLLRVAQSPDYVASVPARYSYNVHGMFPSYEPPGTIEAEQPIEYPQRLNEARAALERELEEDMYYLQAAGFVVECLVRFGDAADEIIHLVESEHMDLVAMATHGLSGMRRLVLGSVAEDVMRRVHVPVLLVRPQEHFEF